MVWDNGRNAGGNLLCKAPFHWSRHGLDGGTWVQLRPQTPTLCYGANTAEAGSWSVPVSSADYDLYRADPGVDQHTGCRVFCTGASMMLPVLRIALS